MKKINGSILKARMDDKQLLINQACFLENLETSGKGAKALLNDARGFLKISGDDSVIALNPDIVKDYNKISNAVVSFNRSLVSLKELNLVSTEEERVLDNLHKKLVVKLCELYDTNEEELFSEE